MLKSGVFVSRTGTAYTIFHQTVDNFERLDICEEGAAWHIDVPHILFSYVSYRGQHYYGDRRLYGEYKELLDAGAKLKLEEEVSSYWELGKYFTKVIRTHKNSGFIEESVQCNGSFQSYSVVYQGCTLNLFLMQDYSNAKQLPMNFKDYETLELEHTDRTQVEAPYYPLSVLKARYDIKHLDECDFVVADTEEVAQQRLQRWLDADVKLKGVDTETTGVDIDLYGEDKMVGVILSYKYGEATYYPFGHKEFSNLSEDFLQKQLMPAIKHEEWREVAHNKKFERKVFRHLGWNIHIKYDTMPLSFMVNPVIQRGAHALKDLMFEATGKQFLELENIFTNPRLINFAVLPKEIVRLYACPDASSIIFLYDYLWAKLPVKAQKITEVEFDLADVKADQEYFGMRVDVAKFQKNLDNCDYTMKMLLDAFRAVTRIDGNINSTDVLSDLIFGKMHCPVLVRTKTGKPSTGAASIKKLASLRKQEGASTGEVEHDLVDLNGNVVIKAKELNEARYPALVILEKYRVYNKLRTAFYSRFERTKKSGRVFFWVNQNGATSGRQSSPMHQLPGELKDIILSDSDEHGMWDPDYSQIELRMIAFLAQEKDLIEQCKDPDNDIHRVIGSLISQKEQWQISAEERKLGKRRNFGVVYLISAYGLAGQLYGAGYTEEQVKIAQKSLDDFYDRFKRIKRYIAMNGVKVQQEGKISTYFGRTKYFPEILDPECSSKKRASIIRQSNNMPVQGTAADYMKLAETNVDIYIRNKGWDELMPNGFPRARVALSIHDEMIIMVDKTIPFEEVLLMIRTCMEMEVPDAPPFFCSPALVKTWAGHDDDSVAIPVRLRDRIIQNYLDTGVSVFNEENYQKTLDDYRENEFVTYMNGLIAQYGRDVDAVANHVRHPSLTHELIARYKAPKSMKLSHEESIHYAVEQYLKGESANLAMPTTKEAPPPGMSDFEELNKLVNFDSEGNPVYETPDEEIEEDVQTLNDDEGAILGLVRGERIYVWTLLDTLLVDVTGFTKDAANQVLAWLWQYRVPDGFYDVRLMMGDSIVSANFRVEDIDTIALTDIMKELDVNGKVETVG